MPDAGVPPLLEAGAPPQLAAGVPPLLEVTIERKQHVRGRDRLEVIAGLSFVLRRGEVTCLLGPSGCGKTTALRIVMGLDKVYDGRISPSVESLRLGVVFQDARLLPWRTVAQNVRLVAPRLARTELDALLAEVGLLEWRDHRPHQLSGGMARRAALARALAVAPDLLILDEAFVSLDERTAEALRGVVFGAAERRRATVLMVTHDVREALHVSDTILLLGPRPTQVIADLPIATPRERRDAAWLETERARLLQTHRDVLNLD